MPWKRDGGASWMAHSENLATGIESRGSTTDAERAAAYDCQTVLADLAFKPAVERFCSARSISRIC